jgi:zinc/manganese transport system permease protein
MIPSLYALAVEPFASFGFMRVALVGCVALAVAQGPIGTLLLLRRMALVGNVLSHAVMPGAALGFAIAGYSLAALSLGGLATGLAVATLAGLVGLVVPERQDASLATFYLMSLALGVVFVSIYGSNTDLAHVLFGTVLAIDAQALLLIAAVSSLTLLALAVIHRPLALDSFDPAFLRAVAGGSTLIRTIFLLLVVLDLVASFQALGTLLAVGPLLLPAAAARCWTRRIGPAMALSVVIGIAADTIGLLLSYHRNLPSGPAIVLAAGTIYGVSLLAAELPRRLIARA